MIEKEILIYEIESVKDALKKLNKIGCRTLLVVGNENKLLGTITDGDIRRYILKGENLENGIKDVYNKKYISITDKEFSIEKVKQMLLFNKIELIPVVNANGCVKDFITWNQVFSDNQALRFPTSKINIPVVVMAGGKGTRLEPFSNIFPKALIPIGEKPIIEMIIDEFRSHGVSKYYITLNHKGDMIESYFNHMQKDYDIKFVRETNFMGTAGSLMLLEEKISDVFIVSNCDVIVRANFEEVVNFHKGKKALLTILSSMQHYKIPYGVIEFKEDGQVTNMIEKPEYVFTINTGVYILNKEVLKFIPEQTSFDMTDLIKILIKNNKKVATYPVKESDYTDIGQWDEYKKAVEKLQLLR